LNINATFFIQIVHVIICIIILERLLIKPWTRAMMNDLNEKKEHEDLLKQAQDRVTMKEQFKNEQWREFQIGFAQAIPRVDHEIRQSVTLAHKTRVHPPIKIDTKEVAHALAARLTHE
jgi:hypothetical protein